MQYTLSPIIQQHELTWKCNNNCNFCYNPERCWPEFTPRAADKDKNIRIAEISIERGVMAVCPTGGEPMLVGEHLYEILNIYNQAGCYTSINSNGRLITSKHADRLARLGLKSALISIHGVDELHDNMVGIQNSFMETWQGIFNLRKSGIPTTPNFVATAQNIHGLLPLGQKLADSGINSMTVTPFLPSWDSPTHEQFILQQNHWQVYYDQIKQIRDLGIKIDSTLPIPPCVLIKFFPTNWPEYLDVHTPRVCMAGRSFGVVSPDGNFRACIQAPYLDEYGGDLEKHYQQSWQNANQWSYAKLLPDECLKCQALDICGGGCRTSCLWENNGSVKGTTMYMGNALDEKQAQQFVNRTVIKSKKVSTCYRWSSQIKTRDEKWGIIIFNPRNQSFTILSPQSKKCLLGNNNPLSFASTKTTMVLQAIGAIIPTKDNKSVTTKIPESVSVIAPNIMLPRLAKSLQNTKKVHCLRADTGERYHF